jgi:hypothetical protein
MSPSKKTAPIPAPTSDVTPESALATIERTLGELGIFGGGQRRQSLLVAGQRLHKALAELHAVEARATELRNAMAPLVTEALAAISGQAVPSKAKSDKAPATGDAPDRWPVAAGNGVAS